MRLAGLQKLTLLDYPGELACTVFTLGCNLRCPFCQNADLVLPERYRGKETLSEESFFSFLLSRKGKLGAVVVSGGEPTLHPDLAEFLERIRKMDYRIKLDTNGTNPEMLERIVQEGLADYVAMDVKNVPEKYLLTCGLSERAGSDAGSLLEKVRKSMALLRKGKVPYEFRTTVAVGLHTQEDIIDMGRWLQGARAWYLQQFLPGDRLVGFGDRDRTALQSPSPEQLTKMCEAAGRYMSSVEIRGI